MGRLIYEQDPAAIKREQMMGSAMIFSVGVAMAILILTRVRNVLPIPVMTIVLVGVACLMPTVLGFRMVFYMVPFRLQSDGFRPNSRALLIMRGRSVIHWSEVQGIRENTHGLIVKVRDREIYMLKKEKIPEGEYRSTRDRVEKVWVKWQWRHRKRLVQDH